MDGYIYSQQKTLAGGVISCECIERRNAKSCMAKLKTLNGNEVDRLHEHTHHADVEKINVLKIKVELKRRAQNTAENTRDVLGGADAGQENTRDVLGGADAGQENTRDVLGGADAGQENTRDVLGVPMLVKKIQEMYWWCRCWSRRGDISALSEGRNNVTIHTERKATASTSPTGK